MGFGFRSYESGDAVALAAVFRSAVQAIGPIHYSAAQVNAWLANAPDVVRIEQMNTDGRLTKVAVDDANQVVAFIDLEDSGHIDMFYAAPSVAGTGLTLQLYQIIEQHARELGIQELHTEASEAAKRFFLRQGFVELRRRALLIEGTAIHNYAMSKVLN